MERTARRSPEVVVRITGRQNGGGHILANFAYISRLGHGDDVQVPLYTSDGDVLRDGKDMQVLAQDWQEWESRWRGQAQGGHVDFDGPFDACQDRSRGAEGFC
jgi:hypothetical protein